jgi:hypothetical protein
MNNLQAVSTCFKLVAIAAFIFPSTVNGQNDEREMPTLCEEKFMGPVLSKNSIKHLLRDLAKVKDGQIENPTSQEIIFDGFVEKIFQKNSKFTMYLVKPRNIYTGRDLIQKDLVRIITASADSKTGVVLIKGGYYRFRAIDFSALDGGAPTGYFSVWKGSVLRLKDDSP